MRRVAWLVLALLLGGVCAAAPPKKPRPVPRTVTLLGGPLQFQVPAGMAVVSQTRDRVLLEPVAGPWSQLAVSVDELGNVRQLSAAEARQIVKRVESRVQNPGRITVKPLVWLSHSGYRLEYQGRSGPLVLQATHWLVVHAGQLVMVSLVGPPGSRSAWESAAVGLRQSVRYLPI